MSGAQQEIETLTELVIDNIKQTAMNHYISLFTPNIRAYIEQTLAHKQSLLNPQNSSTVLVFKQNRSLNFYSH